jgi:hypothetical protein
MKIRDKRTNEVYSLSQFPLFAKWDIGGTHYGYVVITAELKVYYIFMSNDELECNDVSDLFEILIS